ncbi:MAG: hypothetical protein U0136_12605 [Bdellovibrionota bacterium]
MLSSVRAEDLPDDACVVQARLLKGSSRADTGNGKTLATGNFLSDLKEQLEPLPFTHYETLGHERQLVPLHEKAIFRLSGERNEEHRLFVDMECIHQDGARVQIDWHVGDNEALVSSEINLVNGKSWVVGTDADDDSSTIMSIKVECKQ